MLGLAVLVEAARTELAPDPEITLLEGRRVVQIHAPRVVDDVVAIHAQAGGLACLQESAIGYVLRLSHRDGTGALSPALQVGFPPGPSVPGSLQLYVSSDLLGSGVITEVSEPIADLDEDVVNIPLRLKLCALYLLFRCCDPGATQLAG